MKYVNREEIRGVVREMNTRDKSKKKKLGIDGSWSCLSFSLSVCLSLSTTFEVRESRKRNDLSLYNDGWSKCRYTGWICCFSLSSSLNRRRAPPGSHSINCLSEREENIFYNKGNPSSFVLISFFLFSSTFFSHLFLLLWATAESVWIDLLHLLEPPELVPV